jgi:hypothetical protein
VADLPSGEKAWICCSLHRVLFDPPKGIDQSVQETVGLEQMLGSPLQKHNSLSWLLRERGTETTDAAGKPTRSDWILPKHRKYSTHIKYAALPLSSRLPRRAVGPVLRTRISYFALPATTTSAALLKESRMQIIRATNLDRKSGGGAQWICSSLPLSELCPEQRV